jgi:geranylgeranyl pyrophosphate synthase
MDAKESKKKQDHLQQRSSRITKHDAHPRPRHMRQKQKLAVAAWRVSGKAVRPMFVVPFDRLFRGPQSNPSLKLKSCTTVETIRSIPK